MKFWLTLLLLTLLVPPTWAAFVEHQLPRQVQFPRIRTAPKTAYPLSTRGTDIVSANGEPVRLRCANWPGHMEAQIPEGLQHQSADTIARQFVELGFNCVRLTYSIQMVDEHSRSGQAITVRETMERVPAMRDARLLHAVLEKNPWIDGSTTTPLDVYDTLIVEVLARHNLMVLLDNHMSTATWCCNNNDGDGWFGDAKFPVDRWLSGLEFMAARYRSAPHVVAFSLRNELRNQPWWGATHQWAKHMIAAAQKVHCANPNALVFLSGMDFDTNLSFLPKVWNFGSLLTDKLVLEVHLYAWSARLDYPDAPRVEDRCSHYDAFMEKRAGFLLDPKRYRHTPRPLVMTEFGADIQNYDPAKARTTSGDVSYRYLECTVRWLQRHRLGYAIWGIQGSYYVRDGHANADEWFGILNPDWSAPRNPAFNRDVLDKLQEVMGF